MQMKQEKMKGIKLRAIRKDSIFDKMFQIKMMEWIGLWLFTDT